MGPLAGFRVIDMSTVGMGPYAAQLIGDMGADVVKVEAPDGDSFRHVAPARSPGMGAPFLNLNRNKRSIVLDVKKRADRAILHKLLATADVLITNIRAQSLKRQHLNYESVSNLFPKLIYCSLYGFSQDGPNAGRPAFDDIIQAMSGLASLQAANSGEPAYVNAILADKVVGLMAVNAILAALVERERSGMGQLVEVPMYETMVSFNLVEHLAAATFPKGGERPGYDRVLSPHRRPYPTLDGHISLLPYTTSQWVKAFEIMGRPDLSKDPELTHPGKRSQTIDRWYEHLAELTLARSTDEWLALFEKGDVPAAPVQDLEDVIANARALGLIRHEQHPTEGEILTVGVPVKFSRTPATIRRLAPRLDQDRQDILGDIGLGAEQGQVPAQAK